MSSKPFAITLDVGTSLANRTGSWRTLRPVYVNRLPPCNAKCPAGEQCQAWLYHAESGDYRHAWEKIVEDNPFPACMGRVCYHTCESACNRGELDESVGINAVERFLGDHALENGWSFKKPETKSGKRVLVVGAGPAGLSAAYHLARMGHEVCVRDGAKAAGGMMRYGIPKYRLPREVLDKEIARIAELGVKFELSREVTDLAAEMKEGGFDAVFLGVGASLARRAYIPAGDAAHVLDAVTVLRSMEGEEQPLLGRRVVVYGGGNTAIDVARTAKRLGAEPLVVYRRTRERAPAHQFEIEEAIEEGVHMKWLSTIAHADEGEIRIEKMKLDESGRPVPTGEFETVSADSVVLALGQETNLKFLEGIDDLQMENGSVVVDGSMMTGLPVVRCLPPKNASPRPSAVSTRGTTRMRPSPCVPSLTSFAVRRRSTRWSRGSPSRLRSSRPAAACPAATASSATTATASVLTMPSSSSVPARSSASTTSTARAAASAPTSVPAARSTWCPSPSDAPDAVRSRDRTGRKK